MNIQDTIRTTIVDILNDKRYGLRNIDIDFPEDSDDNIYISITIRKPGYYRTTKDNTTDTLKSYNQISHMY